MTCFILLAHVKQEGLGLEKISWCLGNSFSSLFELLDVIDGNTMGWEHVVNLGSNSHWHHKERRLRLLRRRHELLQQQASIIGILQSTHVSWLFSTAWPISDKTSREVVGAWLKMRRSKAGHACFTFLCKQSLEVPAYACARQQAQALFPSKTSPPQHLPNPKLFEAKQQCWRIIGPVRCDCG